MIIISSSINFTHICINHNTRSVDSTDLLMKSSGNSTPMEDNINVVIRVRPFSDKERKVKDESLVQFPGNGQILVRIKMRRKNSFN